jgi:hypothetical protein
LPDTICITIKELGISLLGACLLENLQVTSEDALELRTVSAAIWFARVMKDAAIFLAVVV